MIHQGWALGSEYMVDNESELESLMDRMKKARENLNSEKVEALSRQIEEVVKDKPPSMTPGRDAQLKTELDLIKEQQAGLNPNAEAYMNANLDANGSGINKQVDAKNLDGSPDKVKNLETPKSERKSPTPFSMRPKPGGGSSSD